MRGDQRTLWYFQPAAGPRRFCSSWIGPPLWVWPGARRSWVRGRHHRSDLFDSFLLTTHAKIFGDSRAYDFPKIWAKTKRVVISGHLERISPGVIRSEVGRPEGQWLTTRCPTSERITPGKILSEWPEITTPVWFWPKFLENHTPVNPQKFSRGLLSVSVPCKHTVV